MKKFTLVLLSLIALCSTFWYNLYQVNKEFDTRFEYKFVDTGTVEDRTAFIDRFLDNYLVHANYEENGTSVNDAVTNLRTLSNLTKQDSAKLFITQNRDTVNEIMYSHMRILKENSLRLEYPIMTNVVLSACFCLLTAVTVWLWVVWATFMLTRSLEKIF